MEIGVHFVFFKVGKDIHFGERHRKERQAHCCEGIPIKCWNENSEVLKSGTHLDSKCCVNVTSEIRMKDWEAARGFDDTQTERENFEKQELKKRFPLSLLSLLLGLKCHVLQTVDNTLALLSPLS